MPLKFTPGRAVYDPDRRMVLFLARDENMLVHCAVTCSALVGAATLHSLDKDGPLVVYRALKVRIQAIAREKYHKQLRDEDGVVVVRRKDLRAVALQANCIRSGRSVCCWRLSGPIADVAK